MFLRPYRIVRFLVGVFFVTSLFAVYTRWSLSTHRKTTVFGSDLYLPREEGHNKRNDKQLGQPDLPKYIHLDLKGAPPKADVFYESFFNFLEKIQMGVKGILIEYEDTLPLQGNLAEITNRNGYTRADITLIQEAAKRHQMEIIPLIQTFGHFEWILKLSEYKSYRDDPNLPMVISPCYNATYILLEDLLQQTLDMHPDSNIIHIGCDEVMLKNLNPHCHDKMIGVSETYVTHIQRIVDIVRKIRPGIRILIWDDILRGDQLINNKKLLKQLKDRIEPVSWNYFPTFDTPYKSLSGWKIYPKFFQNTWAASAFKGGLHRFSMITNTKHHVLNNREWIHFMRSSIFRPDSFSAIILTGWSRFDHFMPLCDILPTSYPALLYSLHVLNTDQFLDGHSVRNCYELLKSIDKNTQLCESLPGVALWSSISSVTFLMSKIENRLKILNTIAPSYNRKHRFVRRYDLKSRLLELRKFLNDYLMSKQKLRRHFMDLYSEDVMDEWFDLYLTPLEVQINTTIVEFAPVHDKTSWKRRPLT